MKILITSDWDFEAVNGVVTSMKNLKTELEKRGHEVRLLTLSMNGESRIENNTYYLGSVSAERIYHRARIRTSPGRKVLKAVYQWGPDVVHSQCEFSTFFVARKISKHLSIPLVHTYHTVYEDYVGYVLPGAIDAGKKFVRFFSKWEANKCSTFIAPTRKVEKLLRSYGIKGRIDVIPTGIDMSRFMVETKDEWKKKTLSKLSIPEDNNILIYVGRLGKEKNISEVLSYVADLKRDDITFLIVGDGPYRKELEDEAEKLSLKAPKVIFAGMVDPKEVASWYTLGSLFINASTSETQGLTYVEALAAGTPLLCRKDPALDDVVEEGYNGWQWEGEKDFLSKLGAFLSLSEEEKKELKKNTKESSMLFSSALFAEKAEKLYIELINQKRK
ncbi:MAG: glycosyltransferase [Candidatus Ornithospirochaeta sp.]